MSVEALEQENAVTASTMRVAGHLGHRSIRLQGIRESAFRDAIVQHACYRGWLTYWTWNSKHSPAGFPDLVMVRGNRLIFAELKVGRNKPTSEQERWLAGLADIGSRQIEVYLWRPESWDTIEEVLQ